MKREIILAVLLLFLSACGSGYGIYHTVKPGETFESICSAYGVNPATVARMNNVNDRSTVQMGDALYIPGAERQISAKAGGGQSASAPVPARPKKIVKKSPPKERTEPPPPAAPPRKGIFSWPVKGKVVSKFGSSNGELHDGIDIEGEAGAPVSAATSGRVIYSGNEIKGYGNMVILKHEGTFSTVYAQNGKNMVQKGAFVKSGDVIALVGENVHGGGPMLHFEIREGKSAKDPLLYLK